MTSPASPVQPADRSGFVHIQPPLSRRGTGPGLIVISGNHPLPRTANPPLSDPKPLDPEPVLKWAEEGYTVASVTFAGLDPLSVADDDNTASTLVRHWIRRAVDELRNAQECEGQEIGLLSWKKDIQDRHLLDAVRDYPEIKAVVLYGVCPTEEPSTPVLAHLPGSDRPSNTPKNVTVHNYPSATDFGFFIPESATYHAAAASVSHTRTLSFLKPRMHGPYFDLEAIWDEHTRYEFADRSVEETMKTMVEEPYVNHVPTLTGGVGRANLTRFYRDHFIFSNPADTKLELISRTVGIDRVVDEFLLECTHERTIDWL